MPISGWQFRPSAFVSLPSCLCIAAVTFVAATTSFTAAVLFGDIPAPSRCLTSLCRGASFPVPIGSEVACLSLSESGVARLLLARVAASFRDAYPGLQ